MSIVWLSAKVEMIKSDLKAINKLWGGIPLRLPVAFYGPTRAGKTLLCLQEAFHIVKEKGGNILVIRTEASFDTIAMSWCDKFSKRFQVEPQIYIMSAPDAISLMRLHGDKVEIRLQRAKEGKGGKLIFDIIESGKSPIEKIIREKDVRVLIYDSLTAPIHRSFPAKRENFGARADCIKRLAYHITRLCDENEIAILTTHHQTIDPTNPYAKPMMATQGTLGYEFGYIMYIEKLESMSLARKGYEARRLWAVRSPDKPDWGANAYVLLGSNGYEDIDEKGLKALKKS